MPSGSRSLDKNPFLSPLIVEIGDNVDSGGSVGDECCDDAIDVVGSISRPRPFIDK